MKKRILIISIIVILGLGALLVWKIFIQNRNRDAVEVISSEALFLFETTQPVLAWNEIVNQTFWKSITSIPAIKNAEFNLLLLDSLAGKAGILQKNLNGNQLAVSLHPTGKEEFDFLFVLAYQNPEDFHLLEKIESKIQEKSNLTSRNYSGIEIREVKMNNDGITLAYAKIDNLLAISFTSFLVEDAVRHSQNGGLPFFGESYKELFEDSPKAKGLGTLRIGGEGLSGIVNGIASNKDNTNFLDFGKNKVSANLHLEFIKDSILLEGSLFFNGKGNPSLKGIPSPAINYFKNLIPNRTANYFQYQLEDPFRLFLGLESDFPFNSIVMGDIEAGLTQKGFKKHLTGHIAFLNMEILPNESQDKVLLLRTENPNVQLDLLEKFGLSENQGSDLARFRDIHQGKDIFMINADEFPAHLFNGNFVGFGDTYFTLIDENLVFANSSKAIKLFIDDWKNGSNWGNSSNETIIQKLEKESGFSMVFETQKLMNNLEASSSANWKAFFLKHEQELKAFDRVFLKTIQDGDQTRLRIAISHKEVNLEPSKKVVSLTQYVSVPFSDRLVYGPVGIRNFNDNSIEFVVQDEKNRIYLLTNEGEEVFSADLDGPVVSGVFQFDFYKNEKLQLLFATKEKIYGIDRMGDPLPNFPMDLSGESISHLNLLDYEGNKNYRIFVSSKKGNLYLFDKNGAILEGWNKKPTGSPLAIKPAHHRVAGIGDRMVALGVKGGLHFFNRKGEAESGSPILIAGDLGSDYVLLERGSAKETQLLTVTKTGEVVMVNLLGEITFRNQLMRPDKESRFYLIKDQKEDNYLFVVHEYNKITVLDSDFRVLFSKPMMAAELQFQYFSYGSGKNIFVVVDPTQEFIYLFGLDGGLINPLPINGTNKLEIEFSESQNEYSVFAIGPNGFSAYKLPL